MPITTTNVKQILDLGVSQSLQEVPSNKQIHLVLWHWKRHCCISTSLRTISIEKNSRNLWNKKRKPLFNQKINNRTIKTNTMTMTKMIVMLNRNPKITKVKVQADGMIMQTKKKRIQNLKCCNKKLVRSYWKCYYRLQ